MCTASVCILTPAMRPLLHFCSTISPTGAPLSLGAAPPAGALRSQVVSQPLGPVISSYVSGSLAAPGGVPGGKGRSVAAEVLAEKEAALLELRETNEVRGGLRRAAIWLADGKDIGALGVHLTKGWDAGGCWRVCWRLGFGAIGTRAGEGRGAMARRSPVGAGHECFSPTNGARDLNCRCWKAVLCVLPGLSHWQVELVRAAP
jgi:hypothetical protein